MRSLIIICGMMGSGKTTLAKNLCEMFGYKYIDFDKTYHERIQKGDNNYCADYLEYLDKTLVDDVYVIDGWFTWHKIWYLSLEDDSIKEVCKLLDCVVLHQCQLDKKTTIQSYFNKHKKLFTEFDVLDNYSNTYNIRLANLKVKYERGKKWVE